MKCSIIYSTLCLMAITLSNNNGIATAQQPPTMIGLAIATEHPDLHPANACAKQDAMILDEIAAALMTSDDAMIQQQGENRRNLYTMSTTCKYKCRGFLPGTCWYAFPWCWPFRRRSLRAVQQQQQQQTEAHQQPLTEIVDELEVDHSIDCAKSILAAEAKMEALANTMGAGACQDALLEKKIYECVRLKFTKSS